MICVLESEHDHSSPFESETSVSEQPDKQEAPPTESPSRDAFFQVQEYAHLDAGLTILAERTRSLAQIKTSHITVVITHHSVVVARDAKRAKCYFTTEAEG